MAAGILVLGCHRSGTSAVTLSLEQVGVDLGIGLSGDQRGPAAASAPSQRNPTGFAERADVLRINRDVLASLGYDWQDQRALPDGWLDRPEIVPLIDAAEQTFAAAFGDRSWAVKDPRLCRIQALWRRAAARRGDALSTLIVHRPPAEVVASISSRNGFSTEHALRIWCLHMSEALLGSLDTGLVAVVSYPALLANPVSTLACIAGRLGRAWPVDPVDAAQGLRGLLDEKHRHHRDLEVSGPNGAAGELDHMLRSMAAGVDADRSEIERLYEIIH